ncbi:hypothetical protein [Mesorhizobium sp. STM 4661]|uniref:hypothetical protein n=1 Tax=Mesorhizobium sp. STM 4661 TaxID=1297570 RepID=UPI0018DEED64|nr:hypothetical protein [Mesorhizobium sp. STM 4661]
MTKNEDALNLVRDFADMFRSGAQGAEMDCDSAMDLALSIDILVGKRVRAPAKDQRLSPQPQTPS